jgi:RNA polymerase subunit RPABC4/transcription elongation factor Spt4
MARREDIDLLRQKAETDDLATLESVHKELHEITSSMKANISSTKDPDVRNLLKELCDEAGYIDDDVKQKIAEIKVDMLDPAYEQRKAERERKKMEEKLEEQRQAEMWQQKFATEGFGGLFKGLGDVLGGKPMDSIDSGTAALGAATAAAKECTGCHAPISATAKFCPECGQPVPQEKHCSQCNFKLQPNAKFCPECGDVFDEKDT